MGTNNKTKVRLRPETDRAWRMLAEQRGWTLTELAHQMTKCWIERYGDPCQSDPAAVDPGNQTKSPSRVNAKGRSPSTAGASMRKSQSGRATRQGRSAIQKAA